MSECMMLTRLAISKEVHSKQIYQDNCKRVVIPMFTNYILFVTAKLGGSMIAWFIIAYHSFLETKVNKLQLFSSHVF